MLYNEWLTVVRPTPAKDGHTGADGCCCACDGLSHTCRTRSKVSIATEDYLLMWNEYAKATPEMQVAPLATGPTTPTNSSELPVGPSTAAEASASATMAAAATPTEPTPTEPTSTAPMAPTATIVQRIRDHQHQVHGVRSVPEGRVSDSNGHKPTTNPILNGTLS